MATDQIVSLREAVNQYLQTLNANQRMDGQQEVDKFARWYGRDRGVSELTPVEVAQYSEWVSMESADPASRLAQVRDFFSFLKKRGLTPVSLSPHVKVAKGKRAQTAGSAREAEAQVELTPEGYAQLKARLEMLLEGRLKIIEDIQRAMADKDFRENAPLDAAKERQSQIESAIREIEQTLQRAVVRQAGQQLSNTLVKLGHTVILQELSSGKVIKYTLVDSTEADPASGKISNGSPVGRALLEKAVGSEVQVSVPRGVISYRIERIEG